MQPQQYSYDAQARVVVGPMLQRDKQQANEMTPITTWQGDAEYDRAGSALIHAGESPV